MPRREDDDRFEDDDRSRGSKRRDDDDDRDDDDRSRRRSRDDDDDFDDRPVKKSSQQGPLDGMFRDTSMVVLILFACCCNGIALILSLIGYLTAKDETAKSNALMVLIISGILTVIGVVSQILRIMMAAGGAAGGF